MPLTPSTKLGPYEILTPLGTGGMGEVYRARDTRLDRTVAVKILPVQLSNDPIRKQRFEREAKTISSLNHPNICTLHDVGSQDGVDYLVMECVEGETLAKRLEKGALPLEQVLKYGAQIADGLDKAHRAGIVHRDLKPGNIMLTATGAKLLDFGLAKPTPALSSSITLTVTATPDSPVTEQGTIVGTFQYMSPEQVEGKELDGRSDIFSLGAVLYEMLTGRRAFEGKSQLSVASAILEKEPEPISALKPMAPPALDHTIRKCLAKDAEERWQSASDLKSELLWISQSSGEVAIRRLPSATVSRWRNGVLLAIGAVLLATATGLITYISSKRLSSPPLVRSVILPPPQVTLLTLGDNAGAPAISRDGSKLVFVGMADGKQMLYLRHLDAGTTEPLPGTGNGKFPFWSPDGKSLGFFADEQLKKLELSGGPPISLAPASDGRGGTWAGDVILFTPDIYEGIYRVQATGGKAVTVTKVDRSQHSTHRWPLFLPDGKHFLYLAAQHTGSQEGNAAVYAASIDGGTPKLILHSSGSVLFSSGNLLFIREGSLMAQEFDPGQLELRGGATPIGTVLREGGNWGVIASASQNGVLLYQSAGEVSYPVIWIDRNGRHMGSVPITDQLVDLHLSPDQTRAAAVRFSGAHGQVVVFDLKTGGQTKITFGEDAWYVAWSPDGKRLAFSTMKAGSTNTNVYIKRADGAGEPELLVSADEIDAPEDWTRDGRYLVMTRGSAGSQKIWVVPMFGDRKAFPLFPNATFDHFAGRVSPDGKWIAYASRESGAIELYVTSFPNGVGKWQISSGGAVYPEAWKADTKELYFITKDGNMVAVSVREFAGSFAVEDMHPLFRSPFLTGPVNTVFDVDPKDGQRFIGSTAPDSSSLPLNLITNWTAQLKK